MTSPSAAAYKPGVGKPATRTHALLGLVLVVACAPANHYPLRSTADQARGLAQVEEIEGGKRLVVLELRDLPLAAESAAAIVVWFRGGGETQKAGVIPYDPALREGHFMASTSLRSFDISITAESSSQAPTPSATVLAVGHIPD